MAKITESSASAQKLTKSGAEALAQEISKENAPDNAVVNHLQRQVANAFVLYLNYKLPLAHLRAALWYPATTARQLSSKRHPPCSLL
jgi:hypothetical protein